MAEINQIIEKFTIILCLFRQSYKACVNAEIWEQESRFQKHRMTENAEF